MPVAAEAAAEVEPEGAALVEASEVDWFALPALVRAWTVTPVLFWQFELYSEEDSSVEVNVMSAHWKHCQQWISHTNTRRITHVVETAVGVTICNNLNGSVHAGSDVQTGRELQSTGTDAEVLGSLLLNGGQQNVVKVAAGVVSKSHEHLDLGRSVAHQKLDGCTGDGELGTVRADSVLSTAGEGAQDVLIETACSRVDKLEVGRGEGQQGAEKQLNLHLVLCVICVMYEIL